MGDEFLMSPIVAVLAFAAAAAVLIITPGLDTALVLRATAVEGPRLAAATSLGICCGLLIWGLAVALGFGALLAASHVAYTILRGFGAAYLIWLGAHLVSRSHRGVPDRDHAPRTLANEPAIGREIILAYDRGAAAWFARGLLSNLTNPKVGVFYVTFLPQFVPAGVAVGPFVALLVAVHIAETISWLAALIIATRSMAGFLHRPTVTRALDRFTGTVLIGAGLRLAFEGRR
jgi:threonine/homoserine/homoserine lactone efflux protein